MLKIGGSLFSSKSRADGVAEDAFARLVDLVTNLHQRSPGRFVVVSGGGGIGHGALRESDATDPFGTVGFAEATSRVRWMWVNALRGRGVRAFPLQLGAMAVLHDDRPMVRPEVLTCLLSNGVLPVLGGDCVPTSDGWLTAVSSDRTPEFLTAAISGAVRVVLLTDVPGILTDGPGGTEVLPLVDPHRAESAYRYLWPGSEWDASGAMRGKLDAMIACARGGADCFIMRGDPWGGTLDHLLGEPESWSFPYSRIEAAT